MNINIMNMCLSWLSLFLLAWLWLYNILPISIKTIVFAVLFAIVAFFASVAELTRRKNG